MQINFDRLKHAPETLIVELPDGSTFEAQQSEFLPRAGYLFRSDEDPPEVPPFYPNPELANDQFSYRWAGGNDQHDVVLTVIDGRLNGLITGLSRFALEQITPDRYRMTDVRLEGYAQCAVGIQPEGRAIAALSGRSEPNKDRVTVDLIREVVNSPWPEHNERFPPGVLQTATDLLIPWTEQARIDAGGSPGNPNDTTALYLLIQAAVDNAQTAFENSLTNVRATRYVTAKLTGFTLTGGPYADLDTLRQNPTVMALRVQTGTDMVVGIVQNYGSAFPACGVSNVQTYPGCYSTSSGCRVGSAFKPFAYSMVSVACAIADDTFTHEIGHQMGASHTRGQLSPAEVTAIVGNGFPDPFAKLVPGTFASILSTDFGTPRRLYFSNPSVVVSGVTTGNSGTENNARIVDLLTPDMAAFETRPDLLFSDDFE